MNDEKKDDTTVTRLPYKASNMSQNNHLLKDHFSSTPIDPETTSSFSDSSRLTDAERAYLDTLRKRGDQSLLERASQRLCDPVLFPPFESCTKPSMKNVVQPTTKTTTPEAAIASSPLLKRRDSQVQQELFRLHQSQAMPPSHLLKRMNFIHQNSILEDDSERPESPKSVELDNQQSTSGEDEDSNWNPFKDVSSWIDGSQGVEVNDDGVPMNSAVSSVVSTTHPFLILGTAADDVTCHPHVLSPPLMESLLAFVPDTLSQQHFFLKYSLVRDGAKLWTFLRQVRASEISFLAIETVDGHVFGSFTCQSWRLAQGWYGSSTAAASFLWKMRQSRDVDPNNVAKSIVDQVNKESEIQVFPYREGNVAVQYCSQDQIMLGQGELLPNNNLTGQHYGHALYLESNLLRGSTSNSETFGNPCLTATDERGSLFEVANLEVWTLTPHKTVEEAEQSELSHLFLIDRDGGQEGDLNFMKILVGGPI